VVKASLIMHGWIRVQVSKQPKKRLGHASPKISMTHGSSSILKCDALPLRTTFVNKLPHVICFSLPLETMMRLMMEVSTLVLLANGAYPC
jgi:hypothetical protein